MWSQPEALLCGHHCAAVSLSEWVQVYPVITGRLGGGGA